MLSSVPRLAVEGKPRESVEIPRADSNICLAPEFNNVVSCLQASCNTRTYGTLGREFGSGLWKKVRKYQELVEKCRSNQSRATCRSFAERSSCRTLSWLGLRGIKTRKAIRVISEPAEKSSKWLWIKNQIYGALQRRSEGVEGLFEFEKWKENRKKDSNIQRGEPGRRLRGGSFFLFFNPLPRRRFGFPSACRVLSSPTR